MTDDLRAFVDHEAAFDAEAGKAAREAEWEFFTSGSEAAQAAAGRQALTLRRHFADPGRFAKLDAWLRADGGAPGAAPDLGDPLLARQALLLWRAYLAEQQDPVAIERLTQLQVEQEGLFNRFRAELDGRQWSENDLNEALAEETDGERLRRVWEAAKQVGAEAAAGARELVRLRNAAARRQGFADAFEKELVLGELTEERLFGLLDELERATDEPYRRAKAALDERLAARFGLAPAQLRPWHYGDPFFQRPPRAAGPDLDAHLRDARLDDLAVRTLDRIGLDARGVLARSDLYPRPGKNQHAFCAYIAPDGRDVRVLCNLNQTDHWLGVLLHELGHSMHWEYGDRALPALLVHPPHGLVAETESQLLERLTSEPAWLAGMLGLPAAEADRVAAELRELDCLAALVMARWSLVMAHFERSMFRDPEGDLDTRWWDLVERFQLVPRPDGRRAPDWAAKIHLALFPGSYYVYILGELAVAQLHAALRRDLGGFDDRPEAGPYLIERLYRLGQRRDWESTVEQATGSRLGVAAFVAELGGDLSS